MLLESMKNVNNKLVWQFVKSLQKYNTRLPHYKKRRKTSRRQQKKRQKYKTDISNSVHEGRWPCNIGNEWT